MKTTDFRLGNFILDTDSKEIITVFKLEIPDYGDSGRVNNIVIEFEGILLTEEWLLKFGFEPDGFANYKRFYNQEIKCSFSFGNYARANGEEKPNIRLQGQDIFLERVPKVHQLQNLYFALTGKELTIKETANV